MFYVVAATLFTFCIGILKGRPLAPIIRKWKLFLLKHSFLNFTFVRFYEALF